MNEIQKQFFAKGRNKIVEGAHLMICTNGPFPGGEKQRQFLTLVEKFLKDTAHLATK